MNHGNNVLFRWAILAAIAFLAAPAAADVLYSDAFDRGGALDGSAPNVRPATDQYGAKADAVWTANSLWNTVSVAGAGNVARADNSTSSGVNASLPFTPEAGYLYNFSATVRAQNGWGGYDYIALGFTSTASAGGIYFIGLGPSAWSVFHYNVGTEENMAVVSYTTFQGIGHDAGPLAAELVLDTRGDDWTAQWFVNDNLVYEDSIGQTSTNYISFGLSARYGDEDNVQGYFDNVRLSVAVPEPGAFIILAFGLIGLLAYAARKRG